MLDVGRWTLRIVFPAVGASHDAPSVLRVERSERLAIATMDKTELRLDPLTRDWTIFNENRALPPIAGPVPGEALAPSPFHAGLERFASHTLHHAAGDFGSQVRVVPNRMPIL